MTILNKRALSSLNKQKGASALGVFGFIILFIVLVYLGVKLVPHYLNYRVIASSMEEVANIQNINSLRNAQVVYELKKTVERTTVSFEDFEIDMKDVTYVRSSPEGKVMGVEYEVVEFLYHNISALLHFKKEVLISPK